MLWYDQRGNGRSARPDRDTITMEQLADDAAALLDRSGAGAGGRGRALLRRVRRPGAGPAPPEVVAALVLVATGPGQLGAHEVEDEDGSGPPMPDGLVAALSVPMATDDEFRAVYPASFRTTSIEPTRRRWQRRSSRRW